MPAVRTSRTQPRPYSRNRRGGVCENPCMEDFTLYEGDCMDFLRSLPDGCASLVLTDPPYNIGKDKEWDVIENYTEWMTGWMKEAERVLKENGVLYFWHNDIAQVAEVLYAMKRETSFEFRGMQVWDKGIPYYSPDTNRIYLNILAKDARSEALGYTANTAAMLHEWGHWLDQNMLKNGKTLREQMPDLGKLLEKDAILYTRHLIKPEEVIKTGSDLAALPRDMRGKIEDNLNEDGDMKNGVSDIFSGLTRDAVKGGWGHDWSYWTKGVLEKEAVAHFFEARAAGGRKLEILKAYFPSAYGYFESTLKGF